MGRWLVFAVAVVLLGACAAADKQADRWQEDLYYTHRLHIDGQHALAAQRYDVLVDRAKNRRDADESGLMACESLRKAKLATRAAACFDQLARGSGARSLRTRALLHAAQIRYDDLGKSNDALLMFEALIRRAPKTPAGLRALDWLSLHGRTSDSARRDIVDRMIALERHNPRSQLADNLLLRAAMLLAPEESVTERRRAIRLLERMQRHHLHSTALLAGLMLLAKLHRSFDEPHAEAHALNRVVATHETSYVFGTYLEPTHVHAMTRLVALYAKPLRDPKRAEAMLERLRRAGHEPVRRFTHLATLAKLRELRGDTDGAISAWQELLDAVETSEYDMRRNDERICREMATAAKTTACLRQVRNFGALPVKEVPAAKAAIARLRGAARATP